MPSDQDEPERFDSESARVSALLEEERAYFRSELALGAQELANRDDLVDELRARADDLSARCEQLVARRDRLRAQRRRLNRKRARLVDERDRARAELQRYESSRLIRLTARVVWRLRRMRVRA